MLMYIILYVYICVIFYSCPSITKNVLTMWLICNYSDVYYTVGSHTELLGVSCTIIAYKYCDKLLLIVTDECLMIDILYGFPARWIFLTTSGIQRQVVRKIHLAWKAIQILYYKNCIFLHTSRRVDHAKYTAQSVKTMQELFSTWGQVRSMREIIIACGVWLWIMWDIVICLVALGL